MPEEDKKTHNLFLYALLISCLAVIVISFYFFYYKKDYNFIVQTKCDNTKEKCFYRDCSVEGDCPPNNLSYYKEYTIKAKDFNKCTNEDCTEACANEVINCVKTECSEDQLIAGSCVAPQN